ncbi:MAG: YceI family protein [Albidovulum sp.]
MHSKILSDCLRVLVVFTALMIGSGPLKAQNSPVNFGWELVPAASSVHFQSVHNQNIIETSKFGMTSGAISPAGLAMIRVNLDSVDTRVKLRDARLRSLLFETAQYPEAVITASIDTSSLSDLAVTRRKTLTLPYTLALHGVTQSAFAEVIVTMITNDMVSVASVGPIVLKTGDFGMSDGIRKLEEAAGLSIFPSASVNFNFAFKRMTAQEPKDTIAKPGEDASETTDQTSAPPPVLPDITVTAPAPETPPAEIAAPTPEPAAPSSPSPSAKGPKTLRCKMTSYGAVPAGSSIKKLVPPGMTIAINGKRAKINGVSNSVSVSDTGDRISFRYSGTLDKIGPTDVSMSFVPATGFLSVRTKARRSQAWEEDFPERAGKFTISGTCRRG